jgi:hypothetical protein
MTPTAAKAACRWSKASTSRATAAATAAARRSRPGRSSTTPTPAFDVSAILQAAVDRECAPPWVRHPEPWDNVVVRRAPRQ